MQVNSMQPVFKLELNHKVVPGVVTIGKYDGTHYCLTAATGSDKVIIHSPHGGNWTGGRAQRSAAHGEVAELNLSQPVTTLAAGPLKPDTNRDMLLIGSPSQILAYDVYDNMDLFYKEAPDGVNIILIGHFGKYSEVIAVVGGNSSLQGFNKDGEELFWNVTTGKICSMILFDFDKDGESELIYGSDDSYIRILKQDQVIMEFAEPGPVTCLATVSDLRFAYGVANGTVGIYEEGIRLWRIKSKQSAISLRWSGEALAACWVNGRVDWRAADSGKVLRKVQMKSAAAAMLLADYRSIGVPDLVCVSEQGEVIGYAPYQESAMSTKLSSTSTKKQPSEAERTKITELFNKKQTLLVELRHYEANAAAGTMEDDKMDRPDGALPANTRLQVSLATIVEKRSVELEIMTNNESIVRAALVMAEGMFPGDGETLARHPREKYLTTSLSILLQPPRDVPIDVHVKALVGYPNSEQYHLFELTKHLPRFSMYALAPAPFSPHEKEGYLQFHIMERVQRICIWVNQNFLLPMDMEVEGDDGKELHMSLINFRDESQLQMDFEGDGQVKFYTPSMALAGELVQSLAIFLNLDNLQSQASFPKAELQLQEELLRASQLAETRSRLAASAAERAQLITTLLPLAQQSTHDLKDMLVRYNEIVLLNEELIAGCHARRTNQQEATQSLQHLHRLLQQAARLRVGKFSKAVVLASRKAIQDDNADALIKILRVGEA